ncbi:MAG TPA: UbiX family flavin prenyltransferase [Firmicutes bacterium]|nr:UbiX family flavin prenyltransferase [Bacillota bacterium]
MAKREGNGVRVIVGISGASGAIYGIRLLQELAQAGVETHLIMSRWARETIRQETSFTPEEVEALSTVRYDPQDQGAAVSSGSFLTAGMVVAPCSMKTVAAIAHGYAENLLVRAADVCLKEQRKLILVPRETPLSAVHLENMLKLARLGVIIMPPVPAFYQQPRCLEDIVNQTVGRVLDHLGVAHHLFRRWKEGQL